MVRPIRPRDLLSPNEQKKNRHISVYENAKATNQKDMPRHSKARRTRINNLKKTRNYKEVKPSVSSNTVASGHQSLPRTTLENEDVDRKPIELVNLKEGIDKIFQGDLDGEPDLEENEIKREELEGMPKDVSDALSFMKTLQEAQKIAAEAEKAAKGERPNRPRYYLGNAPRTKREHAATRRQLAKKGQFFLSTYFKARQPMEPSSYIAPPPVVVDPSEEDLVRMVSMRKK